ncbi:carboxypeptidase-like regulatory domain-containing protein [Isoptericola sp. b441]|uniref:alpha-amylase n=1 Tax=Actinotalea lenta TaxID=3064654 RepID=A0ABT9DBI4_9CELL|nr:MULTISPECIES: carboxypeptidase-like regulatory domain-containing protein [unclassified Isoptericola]MDO8108242.1 carboxypeptidase-like regulatory domain-containing protein [Isoptericola sp. b441]MDO8120085.1 carboxypeptidase-like regulatory domain-containing protein [Isoptericola sp. b490]
MRAVERFGVPSLRLRGAAVLALAALVLALDVGTAAAAPPRTGTVRGVVTDAVGPVPGVVVDVIDPQGGDVLATATSGRSGIFRVSRVPVGEVVLRATAQDRVTWYPLAAERAGATVLSVRHGRPLVVRFALPVTATIAGEVLGNFDPLGGATVTVYDAADDQPITSVQLGEFETTYRISGLPPGDVKVGASKEGWLPGFADGVRALSDATVYTLEPGETLTQSWDPVVLYIDLTPTSTLLGQVLGIRDDPELGWDDPLRDVTVFLLDPADGTVRDTTVTDALGDFRFDGLAPGTYTLRAEKDGWLPVYAGQADDLAGAATFTLVGGDVVGTSLTIYARPAVSGQVLGWMDPLAEATVTVYDAGSGAVLARTVSDGDGRYRVDGLAPGEVKVGATRDGWLPGFADGAATWDTATVFRLLPGQTLVQSWDPMVLYLDLVPAS